MFAEDPTVVEVVRFWRKWVGSAISLVLGIATGAAGLILGVWAVGVVYRPDLARAALVWFVEHVDWNWPASGQELANAGMTDEAQMLVGVIAAILCLLGWSGLRTARRRFYGPSKLSDDGRGRIELETEPRVGAQLQGRVILTKPGTLGEVFLLRLSCSERTETGKTVLFQQEQDTMLGATGVELFFKFHIPLTAPESGHGPLGNVREWVLDVFAADTLLAVASTFELDVQPPTDAVTSAREAAETPQQKVEIAAIEKDLGVFSRFIQPYQRAKLRDMTPEQRAELRDAVKQTGKFLSGAGRWALGCFLICMAVPVLLFLVVFVIKMLK